MQKINFQIIFLGMGVLFFLINWYVDIKVLWYLGCMCIIISPFLSGVFLNLHRKKMAKKGDNPTSKAEDAKTEDGSLY